MKGQTIRSQGPLIGLSLAVCLGILIGPSSAQAADPFQLTTGDVVVFAGGTNMLRAQQAGYLETFLTRKYAAERPRFRDLCWEADTVFGQGSVIERWRQKSHFADLGGLGNLEQQLARVGATVVIAQFGQLESFSGREGLSRFVASYGQLIDTFKTRARLVVLISPAPFQKPLSPLIPDVSMRNDDLRAYVDATKELAADRGVLFVDLFATMLPFPTDNGMHITTEGHRRVAQQTAMELGLRGDDLLPDTTGDSVTQRQFETLREAVIDKHRLWYDYWRPANWKLLYGDDARRQFTRGGEDYITLQEEWLQLVPLIERAEQRVWKIAAEGDDPGPVRVAPEVLHGDPNANVEAELAAFSTSDGLRVNLFASEQQGLTSPLAIRWDPSGNAYVTVSTSYPHLRPGDLPNDKVIQLRDTDGNGQADQAILFADGLNIPTGLEWGDGGIYVGQNTELLFLRDTDGDGRADVRRVVLGGFGNGDSHQTINSFIWSPDGELFFGHGDGCESRVETPWGISSLFSAGFYRFRPARLHLVPFLEGHMGPGNPWGTAFDAWGQILNIDGAGGVNWLTPGLVATTHRRRFPRIGEPGGYCGIGYLDGRHLPDSMQGDFAIGDYKANRVKRFAIKDNGAELSLSWKEPLLQSRHRNFRPVDVKVGPDGAIYVVDWYNPVTCHQDDAYRDPTRDKAHGRIWRLSNSSPSHRPPDLRQLPLPRLLDALKSPESWTRYQAKRALTERAASQGGRAMIAAALDDWVRSLDPTEETYEYHLFEALGAYATVEIVEPRLLDRLLHAKDPRARAFATRIVGRWQDRLEDALGLLGERIADEHPRVRMEAVIACSAVTKPQSIVVAARVIDHPMDKWTDYAFKQTIHRLKPWWSPVFQEGTLTFDQPSHLAAVLNEAGGAGSLASLKRLVDSSQLDPQARRAAIGAILAMGGPEELRDYGLLPDRFTRDGQYNRAAHVAALSQLVRVCQDRDVRAAGNLAPWLEDLIDQNDSTMTSLALTLVGQWKVAVLQPRLLRVAADSSSPPAPRVAAIRAIGQLNSPDSRHRLIGYAAPKYPLPLRAAAVESLAQLDVETAAALAVQLFIHCTEAGKDRSDVTDSVAHPSPGVVATVPSPLHRSLAAILALPNGTDALARAVQRDPITADVARALMQAMFSAGRTDPVLLAALNQSLGTSLDPPPYSQTFVKELLAESRRRGNPGRGELLFRSLACVACHQVSGSGGNVGPDLTAVGSTLSADRIAEELIWPNRQVKEGYSQIQVITNDGKVYVGYERPLDAPDAPDTIVMEDLASRQRLTFRHEQIDELHRNGSPMPSGLTSGLSRNQLLDLIQYLSRLGRIQ